MHKSQTGNNFWDSIKDDVVYLYQKCNYSANKIGEKYKCQGSTILYKLKEWNIPRHERPNKKYELNAHYFDLIDNEHKAYWYGFLFADGHVNTYGINMALQKRDKYILDLFLKDLETNIPISVNKDNNPCVYIGCKIMSKALIDKGFNHQKSYSADIKQIASSVPENLIHHFIRGMFDGDGCIGIYNYDYLKIPQCHFGYTGLLNTCEYVGEMLDIRTKIQKESKHAYTIKTRDKNKICEIFKYLYSNATIYINRKYDKFKSIELITFNDYNNGIHKNG